MRLSELHPCHGCRGPLTTPAAPAFFVVRVSKAVPDPVLATSVVAMAQTTGRSLRLAETMVENPEAAIRVLADENPDLETRIHLCGTCYRLGRFPMEAAAPLEIPA